MTDMNILDLFLKASLLVKLIMLILIGFSIASWAIIIQRTRILNAAAREAEAFEDKFWSGIELSRLYQESQGKRDNLTGSEQIFYSGFKEFVRLHRANSHAPEAVVEGASRAMRISMNRELENLETHIPFLGTVGSISPYIGLFGTVWGIMHAFIALGAVKQATLQMVAPGIAEALIATKSLPRFCTARRLPLARATRGKPWPERVDEVVAISSPKSTLYRCWTYCWCCC